MEVKDILIETASDFSNGIIVDYEKVLGEKRSKIVERAVEEDCISDLLKMIINESMILSESTTEAGEQPVDSRFMDFIKRAWEILGATIAKIKVMIMTKLKESIAYTSFFLLKNKEALYNAFNKYGNMALADVLNTNDNITDYMPLFTIQLKNKKGGLSSITKRLFDAYGYDIGGVLTPSKAEKIAELTSEKADEVVGQAIQQYFKSMNIECEESGEEAFKIHMRGDVIRYVKDINISHYLHTLNRSDLVKIFSKKQIELNRDHMIASRLIYKVLGDANKLIHNKNMAKAAKTIEMIHRTVYHNEIMLYTNLVNLMREKTNLFVKIGKCLLALDK